MIEQATARFNIPAKTAIAPTPGAAWAFTQIGKPCAKIINGNSLHAAILPLPVESLRLDETTLGNLHRLGLHQVSDVLALPRDQLPARFGPLLLKRLDQLTGLLIEPLTKLVIDPPISAKMEFDAPIDSLETIRLIFQKLLDLVLADLTRRNHGVRRLRMIFKPDRGWDRPIIIRTISLSRPHRDRKTLRDLIHCETERVDCGHGFVRFQLDVPLHEPIADAQIELFDQQAIDHQKEFDRLLQRLRVRLGEDAVIRPEMVESHLPERAWKAADDEPSATVALALPRPLTLFPVPIEIRVVCEPFDSSMGRPRQFSWQGNIHRISHAIGPRAHRRRMVARASSHARLLRS